MALEGTVKLPAFGTVKKTTALTGGLVAGGFFVAVWIYRRRKGSGGASSAAAAPGMVTDPAGNVCSAFNPATGFCPGTAEDQAALAAGGPYQNTGTGGLTGAYYGSGGAVSSTEPGPGNFADNAEWVQYAINYLTGTLNADPATTGAALAAYIHGDPVTTAQKSIIEEAIAVAGQPPQAGANGKPPGINLSSGNPPGPNGGTVTVPNVVGDSPAAAKTALTAAGLKASFSHKIVATWHVTKQSPAASATVKKGSTVHLTIAK